MATPQPGPLPGGHIRYFFLKTFDLPRMVAFYRDTLGMTETFTEAGQFAFLTLPGGGPDIALYPGRTTPADQPAHWFVVINVTDVDAEVLRLRAHGVAIAEAHPVPHGHASTFNDPEGNEIELHQPDYG